MKRREFIRASATAGLISQLGSSGKVHASQTIQSAPGAIPLGEPGRIDRQRLRGRNINRSTVVCRNGVAATSQPLASMAGVDILKAGGNAIDAAVATSAMMSVVEPMSCGPGGDLFAILWVEADQKLYALNASGRSPYSWSLEEAGKAGFDKSLPNLGPLTWSVPGCVSGWAELLNRFGKLTFKEVLAPAVRHAREGFPVTEFIAEYFRGAEEDFKEFPNAARTYLINGKPPDYGQVFTNPDIANSFEILMRDAEDGFYQGEIAERIVRYSNERGGRFTLDDFRDHGATWVKPVSTSYRGFDVWEIPPNGQGIAALQMLNMLETFDIGSLQPNGAEHLHLFIEAKKLAYEDRSVYYADMDYADVPLQQLISKDYGQARAKSIDPNRASTTVKPGNLDGSKDTIYLCTADKDGNMVSLIQSIYASWGSREVPTGLGFCLQNRGRSFSLDPKHRNALQPHKRPFHTIIPGFLTQAGKPKCALGVMGGDMQPQGHVQVLMNMIDFRMSPQQAGEQPRVQHFGSSTPWGGVINEGGTVGCEFGISDEVMDRLETMGHVMKERGGGMYGGYQAIWREDEPMRYFAGSDPRKDGCAVGY
ncbi:MAG TPA: gamma-glutamyltransferase [bacterium]|nr:gamma-glutamyltransferase [bacterium]HQO34616.1 gamma-glutamyltransferase [bacterium]HQP99799.1 gamma-glutamyltransferase [bacterium]